MALPHGKFLAFGNVTVWKAALKILESADYFLRLSSVYKRVRNVVLKEEAKTQMRIWESGKALLGDKCAKFKNPEH